MTVRKKLDIPAVCAMGIVFGGYLFIEIFKLKKLIKPIIFKILLFTLFPVRALACISARRKAYRKIGMYHPLFPYSLSLCKAGVLLPSVDGQVLATAEQKDQHATSN